MNKKFIYYARMLDEIAINLSCEECGHLLKEKNSENKKRFMSNFIRYVFNMTKKIYLYYEDVFTGVYDYDDFINDAYLEVSKLYDSYLCISQDNQLNYFDFVNKCRMKIIGYLAKTSPFRISWTTWKQFYEINKIKENYLNCNGKDISLDELEHLTGYSKRVLEKSIDTRRIICTDIIYDTLEEDIIEKIESESLYDDLIKIHNLSMLNLKTLSIVYGLGDNNPVSMADLARSSNTTRNAIHLRCKKGLNTIRKNCAFVKKYTR